MSDLPPDPFGTPVPVPQPVAPGRYVLDVEVIPLNLDEPDREWCDTCLLSSGLGFRFRVLVGGAPISTSFSVVACEGCGSIQRRDLP